tara:strand:+ start:2296 stop:2598 length:303 start_codon:yes stop_codon:yes gene_type:complete
MKSFTVTFKNQRHGCNASIEIKDDQYILDAAEEQGIELPFSCRSGTCSTCVARIREGSVDQSDQSFLDNSQIEKGYILPCVSFPTSNLIISTHEEEELFS